MTDDFGKWENRNSKRACTTPRYAQYSEPQEGRPGYAAPAYYGSTNRACANQIHARIFDDVRHSQLFGHETTGNFMLVQIHKESAVRFNCKQLACRIEIGHKINESLDLTRRDLMGRMSRGQGNRHYIDRRWGSYVTGRKSYAGEPWSGVIGRVSMDHRR